MNEIEKMLAAEKERLNQLETPPELEERLRVSLNNTKRHFRSKPYWISAVVAAVVFLMITLNYNAVAFYGKKIFGYDEVMSHAIQQLNEKGFGQIINKTYQLQNGASFTIDAVMTDENRMYLFYTVIDKSGTLEERFNDIISPDGISGMFTNSGFQGGTGIINKDGFGYKGSWEFEPVSPFAKKLTLHFTQAIAKNEIQEGELTFPYDPNKALQTQLKLSLNKSVKVDKGTIKFASLIATPTETVIKGKVFVANFDRVNEDLSGIELIVNGKPLPQLGSGSSSSLTGGRNIEIRFDALPEKIKTLTIQVNKFAGYKKLDKVIDLQVPNKAPIKIGAKALLIDGVTTKEKQTEITISTDSDILLDEVYIESAQGQIPLQTIVGQTEVEKQGKYLKKRTLLFKTEKSPTKLIIGGMHYLKNYNKTIAIPVK